MLMGCSWWIMFQWPLEHSFKRPIHLNWDIPHQNKFKSRCDEDSQSDLSLTEAGQTLNSLLQRCRICEKNHVSDGVCLPRDQLPEWQSEDCSDLAFPQKHEILAKQWQSTILDLWKLTKKPQNKLKIYPRETTELWLESGICDILTCWWDAIPTHPPTPPSSVSW